MLELNIPGRGQFNLHHLVLDFNGTIAFGGVLISGVEERIQLLSREIEIHVITADTNGSVVRQCEGLPVTVQILQSENHTDEKGEFVRGLNGVICMGNGANDEAMFAESDLAIAIIGREGCATATLLKSDLMIEDINDGLDLLLNPKRLIATLRK
ncbi:haloacid dehalogenase [Mesobacillus subterraneus]|uniref:HAD family hydrolase n=1 Tax=Mesobacillus subterraneus TaxID=285983 RepID=UPI00203FDA29|nr:haloacid dehalogenase [Mesobacillus subterraneus]MCM3664514.1 haloacid dehalogenase [Mesobacillus subterraneus]MCM3683969.1 haloacid dehalogenase [Mesobacillus subterraneus]